MLERFSLKNFKIEETDRGVKYQATILLDGKEIGFMENKGHGGYTEVDIVQERETFFNLMYSYFQQLGWDYTAHPEYALLYTFAEHLIDIYEDGVVSEGILALGIML